VQANVARLKAYRSNVVIFPRNVKKPKAFEASAEVARSVPQLTGGVVMPVSAEKAATQLVKITAEMKVRWQ
jgi:large subunit ribosomal protein L13e